LWLVKKGRQLAFTHTKVGNLPFVVAIQICCHVRKNNKKIQEIKTCHTVADKQWSEDWNRNNTVMLFMFQTRSFLASKQRSKLARQKEKRKEEEKPTNRHKHGEERTGQSQQQVISRNQREGALPFGRGTI